MSILVARRYRKTGTRACLYLQRLGRDGDRTVRAAIWKRSYLSMCEFAECHPKRFHRVRYESLVRDPIPTLMDLLQFLNCSTDNVEQMLRLNPSVDGLAFPEREANWKSASRDIPDVSKIERWKHGSTRDCVIIEQLCGDEMMNAHYVLSSQGCRAIDPCRIAADASWEADSR
jgi:hypothetical protein